MESNDLPTEALVGLMGGGGGGTSPMGADFTEYIRTILIDEGLPVEVKKYFWGYSSRLNTLSNLNLNQINKLLFDFDDGWLALLMSIPRDSFTWELEALKTQFRSTYEIQLNRSANGFERRMEATQIKQSIIQDNQAKTKTGFLTKIFGGGRR